MEAEARARGRRPGPRGQARKSGPGGQGLEPEPGSQGLETRAPRPALGPWHPMARMPNPGGQG